MKLSVFYNIIEIIKIVIYGGNRLWDYLIRLKIIKRWHQKNKKYIKSMGIICLDSLPTIESSSEVKLKDLDTISKLTIASLLSTQLACDIE